MPARGAGPLGLRPAHGVDGRVPRDAGPRTRSGPEGSSLKRSPVGAAGSPGRSRWTVAAPEGVATKEGARSTLLRLTTKGGPPCPPRVVAWILLRLLATGLRAVAEHQARAQEGDA